MPDANWIGIAAVTAEVGTVYVHLPRFLCGGPVVYIPGFSLCIASEMSGAASATPIPIAMDADDSGTSGTKATYAQAVRTKRTRPSPLADRAGQRTALGGLKWINLVPEKKPVAAAKEPANSPGGNLEQKIELKPARTR